MVSKRDYYQMLSVMQIKYDCETLKALKSLQTQPILALSFLPFYALFAEEIQNTIGENGKKFRLNNNSPFDIGHVRSKLKLFGDERISKSKKKISDVDSIQESVFKNNLKFSITKKLNIHYNIGIFFEKNGRVIGNTQFFYYMFQNDKYISREYSPEEIRDFGQVLGTAIGSVSEGLKNFQSNYKVDVKNEKYEIFFKNFNTNRIGVSSFTNSELDKETSLLVLHLLSAINFVRFILDNELSDQNTYLIKIKYIIMYYALGSIKKILNIQINKFTDKTKELFEEILEDTNQLMNSDFRSCMMHYEYRKNESYLIDEKYLDFTKPFYGLVETCFDGTTYTEFCGRINVKISEISDALERILCINNSNMKKL